MTIRVVGVGNPWRGDDGVGPATVERLRAASEPGVELRSVAGGSTDVLEMFEGADAVVLVDAMTGAPPGTIARRDALRERLPGEPPPTSSHGSGVAQAIELARALGQLPPCLVVYAIAGEDFAMGRGLSAGVAAALDELVAAVRAELSVLVERGEAGDARGGPAA